MDNIHARTARSLSLTRMVDGKYEFGRDWCGPFLSGSFSADQTHLRAWAAELRSALAI